MKKMVELLMLVSAGFLFCGQGGEIDGPSTFLKVVKPPEVIGVEPSEQKVLTGDPFTFSVTASGDPTLTYQWKYNGIDITGEESTAFSRSSAVLGNAGGYVCRVTSGFGAFTDSLMGTLIVEQRLMFTENPTDANKTVGQELILQAEAIGVGAITYHWEKDGTDIDTGVNPSAATRVLYIASLVVVDDGSYVCQATDERVPAQFATSNAGVVTVNSLPPTLTLAHADAAVDMSGVFNTNGAPLSAVCADSLPPVTDWANVTAIGIDFVDKTIWTEVLEGHGITVTPNVDTASVTFIGKGVDWGGATVQVVPDPLTLMGLDDYIIPWFEVDTNPGIRYFINPNVVRVTLNGADLTTEAGFYLLHITN